MDFFLTHRIESPFRMLLPHHPPKTNSKPPTPWLFAQTLPELLYAMGTGRALCDWQRMALQPYKVQIEGIIDKVGPYQW